MPPWLRPRAADCLIGCVADGDPRYLSQALRLVQSIRWFGGRLAGARVLVCVVGNVDAPWRAALERHGADVRVVPPFHARNAFANKLRFFDLALASDAAMLLLLDCDTVVVRDPLPLIRRNVVQAKIADLPTVSHETMRRLFAHFGLALPAAAYRTTFLAAETIRYCNSGVVIAPVGSARTLAPAWQEYNRRLADALDLLGPEALHCNQASLSLAFAAAPVPFREAPVALNFPLHLTHLEPPADLLATDPAILHYHQLVDERGFLLPSPYPLAQARIARFNRRLAETR